jgi:hypothetical protein
MPSGIGSWTRRENSGKPLDAQIKPSWPGIDVFFFPIYIDRYISQ